MHWGNRFREARGGDRRVPLQRQMVEPHRAWRAQRDHAMAIGKALHAAQAVVAGPAGGALQQARAGTGEEIGRGAAQPKGIGHHAG